MLGQLQAARRADWADREVAVAAVTVQIHSRGLTDAETRLLELLCEGKTLREISAELHVTYGTVRNRTARIVDKLGAATLWQAVAMFKER